MTERANILSFDEAKQGAKKRPSVAAPKKPAKRRAGANVVSVKPKAAPTKAKPANAAGGSRRAKAPARSASAPRSGSAVPSTRTTAASRSRTRSASQGRAAQPARGSEALRSASARAGAPSSRGTAPERDEAKKPSKFAQARRERAKSKADKAFTKQFGSQPSEASQSGPRAAVYKGEMGAKHKRAARMQGTPDAKASGKRAHRFADGSWRSSRAFIASVAVASCLLLTCLFLYPVAQQYYHSVRELDRLQAEYAAVEARNSAIKAEADQLATDAGIQDKARSEFGWVAKGENAVNVYGLDASAEGGTVNANIPPGSVEPPTTWYSPVLDAIFGVK